MKKLIIYNLLWIMVLFFVPIFQNYFSTILFDKEGHITVQLLLRDPIFWIVFVIWMAGNILYSIYQKRMSKEENIMERTWIKDKKRLIKNVTQKVKRGDYSGATETMKIMNELDKIVREDK